MRRPAARGERSVVVRASSEPSQELDQVVQVGLVQIRHHAVVVLDAGRVVEEGTHAELLALFISRYETMPMASTFYAGVNAALDNLLAEVVDTVGGGVAQALVVKLRSLP